MHDSKVCFKCNVRQSLSMFYKHKMMADGHLNKCKSCAKKDTKENRSKNYNYYREYDIGRANLPHRAEARKSYSQTDAGKAAQRKGRDKWLSENVIKRAASQLVNNAIRSGRLVKEYKCQDCNTDKGRIHGHHDNYDYPLSVRWLCPKCHSKWHKENGSGIDPSNS